MSCTTLTALAAPQNGKAPAKKGASKSSERFTAVRDMAVRMSSVAAGTIFGLPIAAARMTARANVEQAKAVPFIGESDNKVSRWISRGIVVPTSAFSGIVISPICSAVNAWKASEDKPFSKEAFCLGQLDESVSPN
jgi:hypothetical protein